jgi:hypothetical protein
MARTVPFVGKVVGRSADCSVLRSGVARAHGDYPQCSTPKQRMVAGYLVANFLYSCQAYKDICAVSHGHGTGSGGLLTYARLVASFNAGWEYLVVSADMDMRPRAAILSAANPPYGNDYYPSGCSCRWVGQAIVLQWRVQALPAYYGVPTMYYCLFPLRAATLGVHEAGMYLPLAGVVQCSWGTAYPGGYRQRYDYRAPLATWPGGRAVCVHTSFATDSRTGTQYHLGGGACAAPGD